MSVGTSLIIPDKFGLSGLPKHLFATPNAGKDQIAAIIDDPRIAAVTVTGSMRAGAAVAAAAGKALNKSLLERVGADPFIVLADADLERALRVGIEARYQNAGEVCLAAKRFILERPIADEFTRKLAKPPGN